MAEYVMKDLVRQSGREDEFVIASAATSREELGNPVYPPVRRKLAEHGIRCDGHAARQMTRKDTGDFEATWQDVNIGCRALLKELTEKK